MSMCRTGAEGPKHVRAEGTACPVAFTKGEYGGCGWCTGSQESTGKGRPSLPSLKGLFFF